MSQITKVLMDDHARLKRLFLRANQSPEDLDIALDVCDEMIIHSTIEEEIFYPALREVNASLADGAEDDHEAAKEVIAEIEDLDPDDPAVTSMMAHLKKSFLKHAEYEEKTIFPVFERGYPDQLLEMGSQAFALRQELLGARPPRRRTQRTETANVGWAARRRVSNTSNMGF
ncbi:MAG TPA: hemerythrin domain-containing protein [Acidimicrobiales bacterium]|nr:hemerythrin domain-containing protein [Acidimicrobiales bacterium]